MDSSSSFAAQDKLLPEILEVSVLFAASCGETSLNWIASQSQTRVLKSSKVPSSRLGRMFHYGGK